MARTRGDFKQLKELSEDQHRAVHQMLDAGETPDKVVTIIQDEWGKCKGIKPASLRRSLYRYRNSVIKHEAEQAVVRAIADKSVTAIRKQFNAMNEMTELCLKQQTRVNKIYTQESKGPLLMKTATEEIRMFAGMLKDLAFLQMETGAIVRVPRYVAANVAVSTSPEGETTIFSWDAEDERLRDMITDADFQDIDSRAG